MIRESRKTMYDKTDISEILLQTVLECGAIRAGVIPGSEVVTDASFRSICEGNACGNYGRCYMCPPDIGDIRELMKQAVSYDGAVLYQSIGKLEDPFDYEGMMEAAHRHALLSQRIRKICI